MSGRNMSCGRPLRSFLVRFQQQNGRECAGNQLKIMHRGQNRNALVIERAESDPAIRVGGPGRGFG